MTGKTPSRSEGGPAYKWWVPLTFAEANGSFAQTYSKHWLSPKNTVLTIKDMPAKDKAVVFNVQETGK